MTDVKAVLTDRAKTHGSFEANAVLAQSIKRLIRINAKPNDLPYDMQEALDMIALKISRIVTGNPAVKDHWLDIAGYAILIANTLED